MNVPAVDIDRATLQSLNRKARQMLSYDHDETPEPTEPIEGGGQYLTLDGEMWEFFVARAGDTDPEEFILGVLREILAKETEDDRLEFSDEEWADIVAEIGPVADGDEFWEKFGEWLDAHNLLPSPPGQKDVA